MKHPWNIYIYILYISMVSATVRPENDPKHSKCLKHLFQIFSSSTHSCICFFFFHTHVISVTQVPSYLSCTNSLSLLHYQSYFLQYLPSPLIYTHTHTHTHTHTLTWASVCVDMCPHSLACEMQNSCAKTDRQMRPFP